MAKALLMKCKDWEYEQEHRLVTRANKIMYNPSSIRSITIGSRMSTANRAELLKVVELLSLRDRLQVAVVDTEVFQLKTVPYYEALFS